jgi:hypothetical protein
MNFDSGAGKPLWVVLSFAQRYQMLTAAAETVLASLNIENPTLKGDEIDFFLAIGPNNYRFSGKVQGDKLEGAAISATSPKPLPWRANKLAAGNKCVLR